ncbi:partner and localizer of BRCA2 isoform X1 [Pristis pectinata]|uniref:partner and localizer of BRCA2 isoform X1 n=1 Tax=Pristis pectinata TaxID=685728 RepID=UPI00223D4928|nr:partner and localizer of BRCA2 isoform X1 [Pristis pectinata]
MENSAKKPLNWETREQLKERLALLKKEYAKTVYKLQRAQKAERIQKHVKKTIAHQNRLQEEQSTTQLTVENEYSPILGTYRSDSSLKKGQVPAEEHKEKNSTITFSVVSEIIECSNESLMSMYKSVDSSAQPCSPSVEEMNPITKIEGEFQSRVKLRKKRSCEVLKRAFEVTSESDEPLTANGEPCIKKMETLDPPINNRDINVFQTLDRCVKENTRLKALPQTEDNSALLKNGTQEVEDHCVIMPKGRIASDSNSYGHEDKSTGGAMCSNEAFPSTELTEDAQLQEAKPNCSKNLSETSESNLKDKTVAVEPGELQAGTTVRGSLGGSPLKSCTLVEGLIFPVEYYVRTTRRMTSCQRQVDLDAVIHSHLGKSRNGGKGRPRKLTHDQSSPVEGTPKGEAEICETLLLFNSQEGDGRGSNSTSLQPDLQDSCNVSGDSQSTKSNRRKGRKRGRGECTKFQLTDIHQKSVERNSNDRTVPSDVQISLSSDVQGENEGKKNELNACQTMPDSNKLYGNTVTNTNSHNFSGTYNFNIKNSSLSQDKAKQLVEPQQKSNKIQTNDFKEDLNDQLIVQGAVNVLEPSSTNSDIDSQEMIPETQQDSSVDTSLKKNLNGTRQSFPLGIDLKRGKAESPVSQPKRRVKLSRGNSYHRTRGSSRKVTERFEDRTLVCSEPLLSVKKPIVKRLFHSQEVQDFDLPEEEYGQLKEKLRAEALKKLCIPSQHDGVGCNLKTLVEKDVWDTTHCKNACVLEPTENFEESHPQKSSCCKELPRTPEKPGEDINSCVQQIPKTASGHKLSSSILLSTPSCTPQAMNDHQHNQSACSPAFPSLGFTPASGSTGCSPVFSQSSYGNQNSPQTGTLLHLLEDVGNCGQRSQTAAGKASQPDLTPPTPIIKEGSLCVFSGREPLNSQDEEDLNYKCETMFSQQEMPNDDCAEEFSEVDTVIVEKDDILTPALATMKLEQKLEKQMLQLISKIQNPSTSCIIDLCTVFWIVKETRTLCIACACETAVFLWAPQQLNQWTNICTWAFDKVPIIELIPIPDAVNVLCVAFGSLEIREVKVLSSTERGCLEHTLLQAGDINAVLGLAGRRLVCSYGTLQSQSIELNTLSKEGRSEQSMQLVPPNEMVLAFSEVEGQVEALIGSTIMSNIVIWNLKTGHLLKKIHLSESYPGTVCQKAYSQSGILFILLSHRYIGTCEGLVGGQICVLRMVGVNPMNGKNRPIMSYTVPVECSGRYIDGGVKGQSIAAIVTPGTLVLWDVLSGHISTMLQPDTSGDWSLFYWAEEDLCLLARKNDSTVYIYKYLGIRTE